MPTLSYNRKKSSLAEIRQRGFTLVEILAVIAIIGLMLAFSGVSFENLAFWQQGQEIRKFQNTFEILYYESQVNKKSYRLNIDLDKNSYYVVEEIPKIQTGRVDNFDSVAGLRTRSERIRRAQEEREEIKSLDKQLEEQVQRDLGSLEKLYIETSIASKGTNVELARPVDFPSLFEEVQLPVGVDFVRFDTPDEKFDEGLVYYRFSPGGGVTIAATIIEVLETGEVFSIYMDPFLGQVIQEPGIKKIKDLVTAFE